MPFFGLAGGFWTRPGLHGGWLLALALVVLVVANVGVQVLLNRWNATFFNALEQRRAAELVAGIWLLAGLALAAAVVAALTIWARMRLQVAWRGWLTGALIARWLGERRFMTLPQVAPAIDSPEFRIAEDVRMAIDPMVELAVGLVNAVLSAAAFVAILWVAGGAITLPLGGGVTVPGFMVWVAVAYALATSGTIALLGRPLIRDIERKNAAEAALRADMVNAREKAAAIVRERAEPEHGRRLDGRLGKVVGAWQTIAGRIGQLTVLINLNVTLMPLVPLIACAPLYLSDRMSLGSVMQIAAAFVQAQFAFNWFFDNFIRIADWAASAGRVVGLEQAFAALDGEAEEAGAVLPAQAPLPVPIAVGAPRTMPHPPSGPAD